MLVNICKGIDLETLDKAIAEFEISNYFYCNKNKYNYLIMSEDTINEFKKLSVFELANYDRISAEYKGNKIAIDNTIPYGKIEIR